MRSGSQVSWQVYTARGSAGPRSTFAQGTPGSLPFVTGGCPRACDIELTPWAALLSLRRPRRRPVGVACGRAGGVAVAAELGRQPGDVLGQFHAADVLHDLQHRRQGPGQALQEVRGVRGAGAVGPAVLPDDHLVER